MPAARLFVALLLLPLSAVASAPSDEDAADWKLIGGLLAMVQQVVHVAAQSPDPQSAQKGIDALLGGENAHANRLASGVMAEVLQDVPPEYRGTVLSIGRDLLAVARREQARAAAQPAAVLEPAKERAVQARKELHAMGLRYWDEQQFVEAARRGDLIAVDLYLAAQGLPAAVLSRNPPPAR